MSENIMGALFGAVIGNLVILTWALWPVLRYVAQHGIRNNR